MGEANAEDWKCTGCTFMNKASAETCKMCGSQKPSQPVIADEGDFGSSSSGEMPDDLCPGMVISCKESGLSRRWVRGEVKEVKGKEVVIQLPKTRNNEVVNRPKKLIRVYKNKKKRKGSKRSSRPLALPDLDSEPRQNSLRQMSNHSLDGRGLVHSSSRSKVYSGAERQDSEKSLSFNHSDQMPRQPRLQHHESANKDFAEWICEVCTLANQGVNYCMACGQPPRGSILASMPRDTLGRSTVGGDTPIGNTLYPQQTGEDSPDEEKERNSLKARSSSKMIKIPEQKAQEGANEGASPAPPNSTNATPGGDEDSGLSIRELMKKYFKTGPVLKDVKFFKRQLLYIESKTDKRRFKTILKELARVMKAISEGDRVLYPANHSKLFGNDGILGLLQLVGFNPDQTQARLVANNIPSKEVLKAVHDFIRQTYASQDQKQELSVAPAADYKRKTKGGDIPTPGGDDDKISMETIKNGQYTLSCLVANVTHPSASRMVKVDLENVEHNEVILYTYRSFTKPETLFTVLKQFLVIKPPDHLNSEMKKKWKKEVGKVTQTKALEILTTWTKLFFHEDFDAELKNVLLTFSLRIARQDDRWAKRLKPIFQRLDDPNPAVPRYPAGLDSLDPFKWETGAKLDPQIDNVAKQLILLDSQIFKQIRRNELVGCGWMKKDSATRAPNTKRMITQFNRTQKWISHLILRQPNVKDRVRSIVNVLKLALHLMRLKGINSAQAVFSALETPPIFKLKKAMEKVKARKEDHNRLLTCQKFFDPTNSFKNLREMTLDRNLEPPVLPTVSLFLNDIAKIHGALQSPRTVGAVSWRTLCNLCNTIKYFQAFQQMNFEFDTDQLTQAMLLADFDRAEKCNMRQLSSKAREIDGPGKGKKKGFFG